MKKRDLEKLGLSGKGVLAAAIEVCSGARGFGIKKAQLKKDIVNVAASPEEFLDHDVYSGLARAVVNEAAAKDAPGYQFKEDLIYPHWGEEIEDDAHKQMRNACKLPISVKGALMADAHVGYGLPIGGVLATENAVIPYAVGVDIACRVMMTVLDSPVTDLKRKRNILGDVIEQNTQFGIGASWKKPKNHAVMDEDWRQTKFLGDLKDIGWRQLGTSGSGNHFVEFGEVSFREDVGELTKGSYLALVSHSGSRGPGSKVAMRYSKLAAELHPGLSGKLRHLAWLDLKSELGEEYWEAMQLMGRFASANHHVIHKGIVRSLNASVLFQVENHHNFAWKEEHDGRELIVHRKGATPAGKGELGYIPGTMIAPGFLVEGLGNEEALRSASHGAGRRMSRKKAKHAITRHALTGMLREAGVELLSSGLDEGPHAYKDIDEVMKSQVKLVRKIAKFQPRIVKMAPEGERPED